MAFDEKLADRVRRACVGLKGLSEQKMFGGIAFLQNRKMFVGIVHRDLMVRLDPAEYEKYLRYPHARPMDFTGRPMRGFLFIASEGTGTAAALRAWVRRALDYCRRLPVKAKKSPPRKRIARAGR